MFGGLSMISSQNSLENVSEQLHRTFADRFDALLRDNGNISDRAFAKTIGKSAAAVGNWRHGRNTPRPEELRRIAAEFKVPTSYLLGHSDPEGPSPQVFSAIWNSVNEARAMLDVAIAALAEQAKLIGVELVGEPGDDNPSAYHYNNAMKSAVARRYGQAAGSYGQDDVQKAQT
jgi:transcriptional regulator with XRE-family HTH domain